MVNGENVTRLPGGQRFYIPSLDGIRASAFSLVFIAHNNLQRYLPSGFGVMVFFFLSGFLITTLMRLEVAKTGSVHFGSFYLRRVLRIFPPLYVVMAIGVTLSLLHVFPDRLQWTKVLGQAVHMSNYQHIYAGDAGTYGGSGVLWSLAVEEHFYLLFPFLYVVMQRRRMSPSGQALSMLGVCGVLLVWRACLYYGLHASEIRLTAATDTRLDSILFGCILAVWMNPVLDPVPISPRWWSRIILPAAVVILLASCVPRDDGFRDVWRPTLQSLTLFPIFIAAIRFHTWPVFRWLNWRWVRYVGVLSYTLYLFHDIVIEALAVHWHVPMPIRAAVALAISLLFAAGMYYAVERPCAEIRRRLHVRLSRRGEAALPKQTIVAATDGFPI